jgi:hypothetical protein
MTANHHSQETLMARSTPTAGSPRKAMISAPTAMAISAPALLWTDLAESGLPDQVSGENRDAV